MLVKTGLKNVLLLTLFMVSGCVFSSFLGHMYAAESMIQLGRIQDGISHLSPDNVSGITNNGTNDQTTG